MANNFKTTGNHVPIDTASADLTGGAVSVQEGFYGIVDHDVKSGKPGTLLTKGVFNVTVPSDAVKGDALYVPGAPPTEGATVVLTKTSASNTLFGHALTAADSGNKADVKLSESQ